jgi:hypothetical protein
MFAIKHRTAAVAATAALALGIPAAAGAAVNLPSFGTGVSLNGLGISLPGFGSTQASGATSVSSIVSSNSGVLGAAGPLGKNGPLGGRGCVAAGVNPNSLGPDGPLGINGPLGPGGIGQNLNCSASNGSSTLFSPLGFLTTLLGF